MTTDVVGIMTSYINSSQHSGPTWFFLWFLDQLTNTYKISRYSRVFWDPVREKADVR